MPGGYSDEHVTHFTEKSLKEALERAGFEVEKTRWILGGEMILKARLAPESRSEKDPGPEKKK